MGKTGKILKQFADKNQELASSGLSAIENLAKVANEFSSKVADNVPFELIGDVVAATMTDMIPSETRFMVNIIAFVTMIITGMVALLLGEKVKESFFAERILYDDGS